MPEMFAKGTGSQLSFDGSFVTITRKGALGRAVVGKGDKRIPVGSITAVQWKPPGAVVNGYIQFVIAGSNEARSAFGRQSGDAVSDENSVVFSKGQVTAFEEIRVAIETAIAVRQQPMARGESSSSAEELQRFASLRDQDIITEEEFAAKKAQILGL